MRIRLALEDIEPNHWIAWALDLPACFSSAATAADAIAQAPQKIAAYFSWLLDHDNSLLVVNQPIEPEVVEMFNSFASDEDPEYIVNAFFEDDRRQLEHWDVDIALRLLDWTRQDLLSVIRSTTQGQLATAISGRVRGTINKILNHISVAENWYFDQMGVGLERTRLPSDPLEMLEVVRTNTRERLVSLVGDDQVRKHCGELWSARKIVRRTLWHERDHTQQITQLLSNL